jgi:hypothetical protein
MKDASEWMVSRVSNGTNAVQHSLIVVIGLAFTTNLCLLVKYHGLDALFFELSCSRQAGWTCANDAHG